MKKNLLLALIAVAGVAPFAAQAQSYFGINIGRSEQKLSADGIGSASDNGSGFRLSTGAAFNNYSGIEAGFVKHASIDVDLGLGDTVYSKPKTLYLAATGTIPVGSRFALTGKVGAAWNRTDFGQNNAYESHRETAPMAGIGATFAFTPDILGVVEYEHYGHIYKEDDVNIKGSMYSVGVRFNF